MTERPGYKDHPLWIEAMALARDAYALAERLREKELETSNRLRRAAVAVPAHVAGALCSGAEKRAEHMLAARGALAEVSRQSSRAAMEGSGELARQAERLDRSVLFEFGAAEAIS